MKLTMKYEIHITASAIITPLMIPLACDRHSSCSLNSMR